MALTGLLIFIYPGSATQITVGLFIALITQRVLSNSNPYIEDADDYLANLGQFQIVLVFLASMVLLVKRMPEQDGAPGNLFKGPLFACVLVMIGLMSLLATACTLIIGASPRPRARTQSSAPTRRDVRLAPRGRPRARLAQIGE